MKELSIEEKAKAYDNALKVLHKYDGANIMFSQSLKEEMFPELAEFEDEKIRKSIIELLNEVHFTFKHYNINKMLAWLEKRDEQKPIEWSEEDIQYINDTLALLSFGCSIHSVGEVQEWLQSLNNRVQLKPEWSEEDLYKIENALFGTYAADVATKLLNKIKSSYWKPNDEQMDALRYVTNFDYGGHKATLVSLYEQLKKL